jgi:hypothetical protein
MTLDGDESEEIKIYLLMLWPSAGVCSSTWPRADDGAISCAEDADSRVSGELIRRQ